MHYYTYRLDTDSYLGTIEVVSKSPVDIQQVLTAMPAITGVRRISKSTYYRWLRQGAQAFWQGFEQAVWGEQA